MQYEYQLRLVRENIRRRGIGHLTGGDILAIIDSILEVDKKLDQWIANKSISEYDRAEEEDKGGDGRTSD